MEENKQKNISKRKDWEKNWKPPIIKDREMTKWGWMVIGLENLELGKYTDIGAFTLINSSEGVVIGEGVELGSHCSVYSVSTIDNKKGKVILKKGCKIGTHSTIMPNVTIGENSIIGAYSFVTKNIPDNVIAYGVPAKIEKILE
tara:strand:- start:411 stop:842 length:432 start_codon:yes stop_codon:yes gene_type:complete